MAKINNKNAFTIVEIIIVVTIIAILSAIAITTYSSVRRDARDTTRQGNAVTISEALEKYYEENGEYPSVASITNERPGNTGESIANKLSVPVESLIMPEMPETATNAITTGPEPHDDYIVYIAQSTVDNNACQHDVNGGCDQFTLRYYAETGELLNIESRRRSREVAEKPDLTVTAASSTSINASWSSIADATSYTLQRSLSSSMSSPTTTTPSSTSESATGLSTNVTYYFRVRANLSSGTSDWSDVESATTNGVAAPTGTLSITAVISGGNAVGTAGGGNCGGSATIERQIRHNASSTSTPGGWSTYETGTSKSIEASQGWRYTFQQQARCVGGSGSSGWVTSSTSSTNMPISAPSAPSLSSSSSPGSVTWTWGAISCPTGTSAEYRLRRISTELSYDSGWGSPTTVTSWNWASTEGYLLTLQAQSRCISTHSTGSWSSVASRDHVVAIAPPSAPTNFTYYLNPARTYDSWTWTAPTCKSGQRAEYYDNSYITGAGWYWVATGQEGWRYGADGWSTRTNGPPTYGTWNESPYPWGNKVKVQHKAKYVCVNTTTNRISADGPVGISELVTVP